MDDEESAMGRFMKIGETFIFNNEKWVYALDKSSKKQKMFEAWNCKTGARMACTESIGIPNKEGIEIIERMANCEISFPTKSV